MKLDNYIKDPLASVTRPAIMLKGFEKVFLKAGESKRLTFEITPEELSLWNRDMKFVVETGEFEILVGASSADIKLNSKIIVN